jgi:hypothetical protein
LKVAIDLKKTSMDEPVSNVTILAEHRAKKSVGGRTPIFGKAMTPAERQARCRAGKRRRAKLNHIRRRVDQLVELDLEALPPFSLDEAALFLAERAVIGRDRAEDT